MEKRKRKLRKGRGGKEKEYNFGNKFEEKKEEQMWRMEEKRNEEEQRQQ